MSESIGHEPQRQTTEGYREMISEGRRLVVFYPDPRTADAEEVAEAQSILNRAHEDAIHVVFGSPQFPDQNGWGVYTASAEDVAELDREAGISFEE